MKKVITYGTFDLLHYGHMNLLKKAKALGDYLIVGVTTENFDINRGKLNVQQSLMERIQAVKDTGLVDEVIPEEYVGQKIDDIRRYDVDIFAIGSDWEGKFDYLNNYCKVVYLDRTKGISSTQIRTESQLVRMGIVGYSPMVDKFIDESRYVSGIVVTGIYLEEVETLPEKLQENAFELITNNFNRLIDTVDAVYMISKPVNRYELVKQALSQGKNVLCESPITLNNSQAKELFELADSKHCILFEAIKTAYALAFSRLALLIKSGEIGEVKSVEATCTSLKSKSNWLYNKESGGGSLTSWGPIALLPIFAILGTDYKECNFVSYYKEKHGVDLFTKIDLIYQKAVASLKVGVGVKSEGELVISGTKAYIYVPSPWWKTEYFEVRYEEFTNNKRYFYKLEGEGIRYEIAAFLKSIRTQQNNFYIDKDISLGISEIMEKFFNSDYKKSVLN
jgi:choline-phosphate cytidylyltransferase